MISERKLVSSHSSFWRNLMPMGDAFVRGMNVKLERILPPANSTFKGARNSLISELSFRLYSESIAKSISVDELRLQIAAVDIVALEVRQYIARLEGPAGAIAPMDQAEIDEAFVLAVRLDQFVRFTNPGRAVKTRPKFVGCGIVDDCEGDILVGSMLLELKNVERDFRIADVRQLITYCSLALAAGSKDIEVVGLMNARSGLWYRIGLNDLASAVSGISFAELGGEVIRYITADAPSR